jgi:regulatory protein
MNARQPFFDDVPADATVTAIEPQPSDPNYRRIRVNGRIAARLRIGDVEALRLNVGTRWTKALAARVTEAVAAAKARRAAMTMLGRRALSRGELVERLTRRGHALNVVERVGNELAADHWIDDERYAHDVAEKLVREKGVAKPHIVERLVRRRIDAALAERIADEVAGGEGAFDAAAELAAKRYRTMGALEPRVAARRLAGVLMRRGYDEDVVRAALAQIGLDVESGGG